MTTAAWGSSPALTVAEVGKRQVRLSWTAATDDYAELRFEISATAGGITTALGTIDGTSGSPAEWTSPRTLAPNTAYTFSVNAIDYEHQSAASTITATATTRAITDVPAWASGSTITAVREAWSALSVTASTGSLDVGHYVFTRRPASTGAWAEWAEAPYPFAHDHDFEPGHTWQLGVHFIDDDNVSSADLTTSLSMPAPSLGTPPPLDTSRSSDLMEIASFLFTGTDPVQTGVDVEHLARERISVVHGHLIRRSDGTPLAGVRVFSPDDDGLGETFTRADGQFDMVVQGGEPVHLKFTMTGMLPVTRVVPVEWGHPADTGDIAMIPESSTSTSITFDNTWHTAIGDEVTDDDGTRRPLVLFPPDTTATMRLPDESEVPLSAATLRMTEYTVGARGPRAMPGPIPPNVAYTWAAEFRFDEAAAAGATSVRFNQPVPIYVTNFLGFPNGVGVPSGSFDEREGAWAANELGNGVVMEVKSAVDGSGGALVELTGNTTIDSADDAVATAQGITLAERIRLHAEYPSGAHLWRFRVQHFSTWDSNWGVVPPHDARQSKLKALILSRATEHVTKCQGSVIECQNRTVGDDIPMPGTPFSLHYASDRASARWSSIDIPVGDPGEGESSLPGSLIGLELEVWFPGHEPYRASMAGTPAMLLNHHVHVPWDGLAYGRPIGGSVQAMVRIGYTFPMEYGQVSRFGYNGGASQNGMVAPIDGSMARFTLTFWSQFPVTIGGPDGRAQGLGGWTLDAHHTFDPNTGDVWLGGGGTIPAAAVGNTMSQVIGNPAGSTAEDVPVAAALAAPISLAVAADGMMVYSEPTRVRRITPDGHVVTVAGVLGDSTCGADGIPANESAIGAHTHIALLRGRTLVISEADCHRVRFVDDEGIIRTAAGVVSDPGYDGDDLPADSSRLSSPQAIALLGRSSLLIVDSGNRLIRRFDMDDMHLRNIAGNTGFTFPTDEFVAASDRTLMAPYGVDVGPAGEIVFTDVGLNAVFRLGVDGRVQTIAGAGLLTVPGSFSGDGGDARAARLNSPVGVRVQRDGTVLVVDRANARVRQIRPDLRISTLIGYGVSSPFSGWGRLATNTTLTDYAYDVAVTPNGRILVADMGGYRLGELRAGARMESGDNVLIPGAGGSEIYTFNRTTGCHLGTIDSVSQQPRYTFVFGEGGCRPTAVVLGNITDGNVVGIHRASATDVRVRGPFYTASGEETQLLLDANGHLEHVVHGDDEWDLTHGERGLLETLRDPLGREHTFTYETDGRLISDTSPEGVTTRLSTDDDDARTGVFTVHRVLGSATATGPEYVHTVRSLPSGERQYVDTAPGGDGSHTVTSTTTVQPNGVESTVVTSGTTTLSTSGSTSTPDPRLGAWASYVSHASATSAGRTLETRHEREVTMTSATPPVPTQQIDRSYVNSETNPRATTQYDAAHSDCGGNARVLETSRGGRVVRTCLDARGRVASVLPVGASPTMHAVEFHYDARGRMDQVTQGNRRVVSTWRTDGRPYETAVGTVTGGVFTAMQTTGTAYGATTRRPVSQSLSGSRTVGMAINAMGELTSLTPPGRAAHTMAYDDDGRMESFSSPAPDLSSDPLVLGWTYNARRQLTRHTRADASHIDLAYDDDVTGHLETVTFPVVGALSYGYRPLTGAGETVSDPSGCQLRTTYDSETLATGVVLENAISGSCEVTGTVTRTVNALFETTALTVGDAPAVDFTIDTDGDHDRLVTAVGGMVLARDAAVGRPTGTSIGAVETAVAYTAYGEPASVTATVSTGSPSMDGGVSSTTELGLGYAYDGLGRIESVTESGHLARTTEYGYDAAGRLETVTRGMATVESYDYDGTDGLNGNRTSWTNASGSYTATYDAQDRLTSSTVGGVTTTYGYDDHGSMTTRTTAGATTTYGWDARGALATVTRPASAPVIAYVLDPQGRRIGRKVGGTLERGWLYAGGLHPVAETDDDGTTVRRVFVYATRGHSPDLVMQREGSTWVTYRVLSDHLGSVRAVVRGSDGAVVQRMDYDALGRVVTDWVDTTWGISGWVPLPFGYAGGLYDRDTGLVRFGAREYDASVGRWMSRDPLLFGGGDGNLYQYCLSDSVNLIDLDGQNPERVRRIILEVDERAFDHNVVPDVHAACVASGTLRENGPGGQSNSDDSDLVDANHYYVQRENVVRGGGGIIGLFAVAVIDIVVYTPMKFVTRSTGLAAWARARIDSSSGAAEYFYRFLGGAGQWLPSHPSFSAFGWGIIGALDGMRDYNNLHPYADFSD